MAKRGEKFPEEERTHGAFSPGVVTDDEGLERRLPPGARETPDGTIPRAAFPRRELQWTKDEGGASVDRCRFVDGISGRQAIRSTVTAKAEDIRNQTDQEGNRLWSITDRAISDNRAHAEIQREPRGKMPGRAERDRFLELWRGATALLTNLKAQDPHGEPNLQLVPDAGLEVHWRSGQSGILRRVLQVESVAEAVRAYVGAGIVAAERAAAEQHKLEQALEKDDTHSPSSC